MTMDKSGKEEGYYLIRKSAVPEVLQKVAVANKLLASGKARTVNEATAAVGISRSTYYKYADDIEEFHDSAAGTTLTLIAEIQDEPGLLSDLLRIIAANDGNILTIHQSIPLNGVASLSVSVQIPRESDKVGVMLRELEELAGVRRIKIAAADTYKP